MPKKKRTPAKDRNPNRVAGGQGGIKCNRWKQCVDAYRKEHPGVKFSEALQEASKIYNKKNGKCDLTVPKTLVGCKRKGKSKHQNFKGAPRKIFKKKPITGYRSCANAFGMDPKWKNTEYGALMKKVSNNYEPYDRSCTKGNNNGYYIDPQDRWDLLKDMTIEQLRRTEEYREGFQTDAEKKKRRSLKTRSALLKALKKFIKD